MYALPKVYAEQNPAFASRDTERVPRSCSKHILSTIRLIDRKQELRRLLSRLPATSAIKYADHVDGSGISLLLRVCDIDLEGIVPKEKSPPYVHSQEETTWVKILNPTYSQRQGREELFDDGERVCYRVSIAGRMSLPFRENALNGARTSHLRMSGRSVDQHSIHTESLLCFNLLEIIAV